MNIVATQEPGVLCARCQALKLDKFITPGFYGPRRIANVTSDSIQDDCALCSLVSEFITTLQAKRELRTNGNTPPDDAVSLMVHRYNEDWRTRQHYWETVSLSISTTHSFEHNVWLFPMEQPPAPTPERMYGTGRMIDVASANLDCARAWIRNCKENHDCRSPIVSSLKTPLKVIDCQTRRVRILQANESYICLSYVWGHATVSNKSHNLELPEQIPKTIEDAMWVALELGIPRIWVDQYCIAQDDLEEKLNTIAAMNQIYGSAELTVIAASGDSSYGLPGVRDTLRKEQRFVRTTSCTFVVAGDICQEIRSSRWNSRGWTYQEGLLTPRRLVFTKSQMYFQCDEMHCLESLTGGLYNPSVPDDRGLKFFPRVGSGLSLNAVHELIMEYFPRHLSFGSDSINALEGVMNAFSDQSSNARAGDTRTKHFFGIPCFQYTNSSYNATGLFADGLLWTAQSPVARVSSPMNNPEFPSWSWAACKAAHPSSTNYLLFDYIWKGMLHQEDITFRIKHSGGKEVNLDELMTSFEAARYTEFYPWIWVTTWTIGSQISVEIDESGVDVPQFLGIVGETVNLDEHPSDEGEATALYMGVLHVQPEPMLSGALPPSPEDRPQSSPISSRYTEDEEYYQVMFLLVRETERAAFRRIGLWSVRIGCAPANAMRALEEVLKLKRKSRDDTWKRAKLRLV
ncbi:heterokaryon incompatibility protein-domain-containing protein [Lophiotrema nucula]|uniref:Heterokaryon incompatibility protein-domain-containing protein n=1 Tax=Lophiotrema nucula TaxID=690887 RepID=A0A6A5ZHN2_9PLEO|nr:heterokaryon incompatibility protein-domain-containing protein [Lophiotrema nucula]